MEAMSRFFTMRVLNPSFAHPNIRSDSHVQNNLDTSIHLSPFFGLIARDRSDVPIPFDDKALRIRSILFQNMYRLSCTGF